MGLDLLSIMLYQRYSIFLVVQKYSGFPVCAYCVATVLCYMESGCGLKLSMAVQTSLALCKLVIITILATSIEALR